MAVPPQGGQNPAYRPSRRASVLRPSFGAAFNFPFSASSPSAHPSHLQASLVPRRGPLDRWGKWGQNPFKWLEVGLGGFTTCCTRRGGGDSVFTGEYRHTIDGKGRVAVPVRFRAQLDGGAFVSRWLDNCLAVFPRAAWDELAAKVAALPTGNATAREFSRFLFGSAFELEIDAQGRLLLPATLRDWSGLEGEAMVVGARDHAEIWTPKRWDGYRGTMDSSDALAAQLEGLGF
jgi:MraZ protein